jgi:hypothetical protein
VTVDGITDAELAAARTTVLDTVRGTLSQGGLSLRPADLCTWPDGTVWCSQSDWLGSLAQTEERALVFVAVSIVERIATSTAWGSPDLEDHQIRLDLVAELDAIDGRAFELADLCHRLGVPGRSADDTYGAVLTRSWEALVDRVAALATYADRLHVLDAELTDRARAQRRALAEAQVERLVTGWAGDELAADQVRDLAGDLGFTSGEPSHRNGT